MKHSSVSPSSAERFFNCPGSVQAQAKIDLDLPANQAAIDGIAMHELAAKCLRENQDPRDLLGSVIDVKNGSENFVCTVTDDFVYAVDMYKRVVDGLLDEHGLDIRALQIEVSCAIPEVDKDARGTTDLYFYAGDTLYVLDFKSGRGIIVDPEENKQCMYYALRPFLDAQVFVQKIVIGIIQPRAKEGEFVKYWETTPERLLKFKDELKEAISKTREKSPNFNSGSWCAYCSAAGVCRDLQKSILVTTKKVMPSLDKCFPTVTSLTPEQIGNALPSLILLKELLDNLEGYALTLAKAGKDIPGYALVKGKKNRQWKDEQAVIDAFGTQNWDQIMKTDLRSPAQVEKILGKEAISDFIFTPEGEYKLVMEKEAKDIIKRKVEDVFKNVTFE